LQIKQEVLKAIQHDGVDTRFLLVEDRSGRSADLTELCKQVAVIPGSVVVSMDGAKWNKKRVPSSYHWARMLSRRYTENLSTPEHRFGVAVLDVPLGYSLPLKLLSELLEARPITVGPNRLDAYFATVVLVHTGQYRFESGKHRWAPHKYWMLLDEQAHKHVVVAN